MTLRRFWVGVAVLASVSCAPATDDRFRDPDAPLSATSRFDAAAFAGTWRLVASFQPEAASFITATYDPDTAQTRLTTAAPSDFAGAYREGRPGELVPVSRGRETLVVMWVDEDFETAAIGTPSGRFGALLDRDGVVPEDRFDAARDVFEFNGWKTETLRRTGS
jgi:apolipoprotein D and lipocalin family protein